MDDSAYIRLARDATVPDAEVAVEGDAIEFERLRGVISPVGRIGNKGGTGVETQGVIDSPLHKLLLETEKGAILIGQLLVAYVGRHLKLCKTLQREGERTL